MVSLKRYPDTNLNAALLRFLSEARDRTIPHVLHWLQIIGWLVCVVYSTIPAFWLMIHPFAERWRARRHSPYLVLLPVWMAMWVVVALVTRPWHDVLLYREDWLWSAAALLFACGMCA